MVHFALMHKQKSNLPQKSLTKKVYRVELIIVHLYFVRILKVTDCQKFFYMYMHVRTKNQELSGCLWIWFQKVTKSSFVSKFYVVVVIDYKYVIQMITSTLLLNQLLVLFQTYSRPRKVNFLIPFTYIYSFIYVFKEARHMYQKYSRLKTTRIQYITWRQSGI